MTLHGADICRSYTSLPKDGWICNDLFCFAVFQRHVLTNLLMGMD